MFQEKLKLVLNQLKLAGIEGLTINECSLKTKMMRVTANKYLDNLLSTGSIISFRKGPAKIFLHIESAFFQLEKLLGKKGSSNLEMIPKKQIQQIKKISIAIGMSPEEFIQRAIDEFLAIGKLKMKERLREDE